MVLVVEVSIVRANCPPPFGGWFARGWISGGYLPFAQDADICPNQVGLIVSSPLLVYFHAPISSMYSLYAPVLSHQILFSLHSSKSRFSLLNLVTNSMSQEW